jgi:hypothetical protein
MDLKEKLWERILTKPELLEELIDRLENDETVPEKNSEESGLQERDDQV